MQADAGSGLTGLGVLVLGLAHRLHREYDALYSGKMHGRKDLSRRLYFRPRERENKVTKTETRLVYGSAHPARVCAIPAPPACLRTVQHCLGVLL